MIKILMWIVVAIVIVGGLAWFMSSDSTSSNTNTQQTQGTEVTQSSSIVSDEQVFTEIDNALEGLG